jgi:hypothetical protein
MGHLEAQTTRAACDQGDLTGQIEQLLDGACHAEKSFVVASVQTMKSMQRRSLTIAFMKGLMATCCG